MLSSTLLFLINYRPICDYLFLSGVIFSLFYSLSMIIKTHKKTSWSCQQGEKLPVKEDLVARFLTHVAKTPDKQAIISSNMSWTYQDLYHDVCVIKAHLQERKVNGPVALYLHRTPRLISTLLALMWLELPYIPIERSTPIDRLRAVLEDSSAGLIIHDGIEQDLFTMFSTPVLSLMNCKPDKKACGLDALKALKHIRRKAHHLAYIIYTSGSTGVPKGVKISNLALNHFLTSCDALFQETKQELFLATTTIAFDIAALELYLPIWQGKTMFLANDREHKDPFYLLNILEKYPVTCLQGTPAFWSMLCFSGWEGNQKLTALCGGEPLKPDLAASLLPRVKTLWNMYGPTEATIWCACKKVKESDVITIGKVMPNMEMWVMDEYQKPLPIGKKGELYIGGLGLAQGYWNRDALNKEKFVPYKHATGNTLYRTGDVASMTAEGEVILYGRVDNQVKLHGYRIELEDIESHIQSYEGVNACAVAVIDEQMIAYLCCDNQMTFSVSGLLDTMALELPHFMVPSRVVFLNQLPLNVSGKIDRNALPKPNIKHHVHVGGLTPIESELVEIWQDALGIDSIDVADNFFELGGHSLIAARIVAKIQDKLQKPLKIQDIYHSPTIQALAELIAHVPSTDEDGLLLNPLKNGRFLPLADFQFVLWASHLFEHGVKKINVVGRKRITGSVNIQALREALKTLQVKHDIFSYKMPRVLPFQKQSRLGGIILQEENLAHLSEMRANQHLNRSMVNLYNHTKWKRKKPLILVKVFQLVKSQVEIQVTMSHMIADQKSMEVFFKDLSDAYLMHCFQKAPGFRTDHKTYANYVRQEYSTLQHNLPNHSQYWNSYLKDVGLFKVYKKDMLAPKDIQSYSSFFELSDSQIETCQAFCVKHAVTMNDLICALVAKVLSNYKHTSKPQKVMFNRVQSTREDPYFDEVVGCFLRGHVIKLELHQDTNPLSLAKQVQKEVVDTAQYQTAPTMIKFAAIGKIQHLSKGALPKLLSILMRAPKVIKRPPYYLSMPLLEAYHKLTTQNNERGYVVNVNIWDNFFIEPCASKSNFLGYKECTVPFQKLDLLNVNQVLDVCLMRDGADLNPYLVISATLKPEVRERLAQDLLSVIKNL